MQPSGLLSMSGLASSTPFLRKFFDSWKVKPHFVAREEYKNIINQFTQASQPSSTCSPSLLMHIARDLSTHNTLLSPALVLYISNIYVVRDYEALGLLTNWCWHVQHRTTTQRSIGTRQKHFCAALLMTSSMALLQLGAWTKKRCARLSFKSVYVRDSMYSIHQSLTFAIICRFTPE